MPLPFRPTGLAFGAITFLAAGERIRLKGTYRYGGRKIFDFDDAGQHRASGSKGCSHEWWHKFNEKKDNEQLKAHAHMKMREVAYFLNLLAGPDAREANGKTILENSLFTISTESGDGRHNDTKRELSGVFHAITSAEGSLQDGPHHGPQGGGHRRLQHHAHEHGSEEAPRGLQAGNKLGEPGPGLRLAAEWCRLILLAPRSTVQQHNGQA